eukprot:TRINITY_DN44756_c0_g1_i1.p1 TRINITY_DN44756_c0_g1~~TRINITY_DN44756_c0_g1_i1.p1  ORF type:complete len:1552 (+),score=302.95 TRINITY_DN44756_c0_g1_i1:152-4807(+)
MPPFCGFAKLATGDAALTASAPPTAAVLDEASELRRRSLRIMTVVGVNSERNSDGDGASFRVHQRCPSALVPRLLITSLAVFATITMQGCLPPDWSFCDCDFRDNFWNHVLNDVHMLFDGGNLARNARDNTTFQGRYLERPPKDVDCPVNADRFWKAWPQFGMSRALIEGSMGDLWMPAARDRLKGTCMAGHLALSVICSQHFLIKAARMQENGEPNFMSWLEASYSHMFAIRNLAGAKELRNCLGQQGWPLKIWGVVGYVEKWLGPENKGTSPMAAYLNGKVDPYQMLITDDMRHTAKSRKDALPDRQPCVPFKDPICWKRMSKLLMETCEHCCSPFEHKSGRGDPMCFDDVYTYERCCHGDYKDLICRKERKGEEGGCVDCPKTVNYVCLTPPERRLHDAQNNYNKEVDKYNNLRGQSQALRKQILETQEDITTKDGIYRQKHETFQRETHIHHAAFHNYSRLFSTERLRHQKIAWNISKTALTLAEARLKEASAELKNVTAIRNTARSEEGKGKELLKKNESALSSAEGSLRLAERQHNESVAAQARAEDAVTAAEAEIRRTENDADILRANAAAFNQTFEMVCERTATELSERLALQSEAEDAFNATSEAEASADRASKSAKVQSDLAKKSLADVAANLSAADKHEATVSNARNVSALGLEEIARMRLSREDDLAQIRETELALRKALMDRADTAKAMECLMAHTTANASARPKVENNGSMANETVVCDEPEDQNEFCSSWAAEGECQANPSYMRKACPVSCGASFAEQMLSATPTVCTTVPRDRTPFPSAALPDNLDALIEELSGEDPYLGKGIDDVVDEEPLDAVELQFADAVSVPEEYKREVDVAEASLEADRARIPVAEREAAIRKSTLADATKAREEAARREGTALAARKEAASIVEVAENETAFHEELVRGNESEKDAAEQVLEARRDELRKLRATSVQALSLEQSLERAQLLAEDTAVQKQDAVARIEKQCSLLEGNVQLLNESMSQNMTTVVSAWIQDNEEPPDKTSWGGRLLSAAKSALVSMVNSVEAFLDKYVVSIKDRQMILEMIRSLEDLKAMRAQLREAEKAAEDAENQAGDAWNSLSKATAARASNEKELARAEKRVPEAEEALKPVEAMLAQAKLGLEAANESLESARNMLVKRDTELNSTKSLTEAAVSTEESCQQNLSAAEADVDARKADVVQAVAAVSAARVAHREALASASRAFFTKLQRYCGATAGEFELYKESEELLSFLRAVIASRTRILVLAKAYHERTAANHSIAEVAYEKAREASFKWRAKHERLSRESDSAAAELKLREAELVEARSKRIAAENEMKARKGRTDEVLQVRSGPRKDALNATSFHAAAVGRFRAATEAHASRLNDLEKAVNTSHTRVRELASAQEVEPRIREATEAARVWFDSLNASLHLDEKERIVTQATAFEKQMREAMESRKQREQQMSTLLKTHEQHLELLNKQVELKSKDDAMSKAKKEHDAAETALKQAMTKLDSLVKQETKCLEDIQTSYAACGTLMKEHELATEVYNKQDPEDRKRSFATSLGR